MTLNFYHTFLPAMKRIAILCALLASAVQTIAAQKPNIIVILHHARDDPAHAVINGAELLFNLADDMSEKTDLLSKQPEKAKELRELLVKWESQMVPPKPRAAALKVQRR